MSACWSACPVSLPVTRPLANLILDFRPENESPDKARGPQGHAEGTFASETWLELMAPTAMTEGFRKG